MMDNCGHIQPAQRSQLATLASSVRLLVLCQLLIGQLGWAALNLPGGIENVLGFVPKSTFQCERDGYFGDIDNDCKIFHLCQRQVHPNGRTEWQHWTYACGNQTMFNQLTLTCAFVDEAIPCRHASQFQYLNEVIHKPAEPFLTDADVTSGFSYYNNRIMSDGARARAFEDSQLLAKLGGSSGQLQAELGGRQQRLQPATLPQEQPRRAEGSPSAFLVDTGRLAGAQSFAGSVAEAGGERPGLVESHSLQLEHGAESSGAQLGPLQSLGSSAGGPTPAVTAPSLAQEASLGLKPSPALELDESGATRARAETGQGAQLAGQSFAFAIATNHQLGAPAAAAATSLPSSSASPSATSGQSVGAAGPRPRSRLVVRRRLGQAGRRRESRPQRAHPALAGLSEPARPSQAARVDTPSATSAPATSPPAAAAWSADDFWRHPLEAQLLQPKFESLFEKRPL